MFFFRQKQSKTRSMSSRNLFSLFQIFFFFVFLLLLLRLLYNAFFTPTRERERERSNKRCRYIFGEDNITGTLFFGGTFREHCWNINAFLDMDVDWENFFFEKIFLSRIFFETKKKKSLKASLSAFFRLIWFGYFDNFVVQLVGWLIVFFGFWSI